ncbi:hypothetical protein B9479_006141 [Cryptococcus floricola]|uniref:Cytoplasmic protein n=1 Tax=Cryptococcus floricola TaxID=2591691 RepID=A0A5D3ARB7_9TREE|nr:hypothetical protein B9479_006141 [Cryptococcus floricola]
MSKRLSKRKQREVQEIQSLSAATPPQDAVEEESEEDTPGPSAPVNAFAALGGEDDDEEEEEDEEPGAPAASAKKGKKKNNKKKKKKAKAPDPFAGLDEVDRALAELRLRYGEDQVAEGSSMGAEGPGDFRGHLAFRNLLSVDPKNLDADAELRRFFGSKVIASSAQPNKHRGGPSAKLRYTISKPKSQYPPANSLAGLVMREMTAEEVEETCDRRDRDLVDKGENWFTFEHIGVWREVERQFMGAVRSHGEFNPNQLMALLQVYPWHVDTLLQMSEVYRLQSDIGAASDYAERALYAFDRCLLPSFNVLSGASRLDFDRVENRAMFTALHRIISYLGRRGCWVTAFNFAKLLFALDPEGDPHGAAFWLDFLAIKSGNAAWLTSMIDQGDHHPAAASWYAYPGMAFAKALALRVEEDKAKSKNHTNSDEALREAITDFPQMVVPLADKIGASLPAGARSEPLLKVEAAWDESPTNVIHLLSHIYVARSEALWKEADKMAWLESQVPLALAELHSPASKMARDDILALVQAPRDPVDDTINVSLFICRHVMCSENTSWLGFLPPLITARSFNSFDPLPPTTAISMYDDAYFAGIRPQRRGAAGSGASGQEEGAWGMMNGFIQQVFDIIEREPENWRERAQGVWNQLTRENNLGRIPEEDRQNMFQGLMQLAENMADGLRAQGGDAGGRMPGMFPGAEGDE